MKTYHRRGLQSIAKMTCQEKTKHFTREHPNAYKILKSKHVPPEIFSLPSLGSDQLKYAEDAYFASQEKNNMQKEMMTRCHAWPATDGRKTSMSQPCFYTTSVLVGLVATHQIVHRQQ